ncbi:MAG: beta-hydroxyacyl-ACP dehydratase [Myxococcota bacterium]
MARLLTPAEVLPLIPQQEPFRFVDEILEIGDEKVAGTYRWRPEADFYRGHFPGNPVTPGVLLVECMAQCSVVPLAIYLFHRDFEGDGRFQTLFTDASMEFSDIVRPGEQVRTDARLVFWRRKKLKVEAEMRREDGALVCTATLAGIGVVT